MPAKKSIIRAEAPGNIRVNSGPVQFGTDWPGLFLRGDHAMKVAQCVRHLQKELDKTSVKNDWAIRFLAELAVLIESEVDMRNSSD
jgi:hypothetical protein